MTSADRVAVSGIAIVIAGLLAFGVATLRRPHPPGAAATGTQRDRRSMIGVALQGAAYFIVWWNPRFGFLKLLLASQSHALNPLTAAWLVLIAGLTLTAVLLARAAIYTLGKQWTIVAEIGEGHSLVTHGPYARVRNPIYTAMLLFLLAIGLAANGPVQLAVALLLFAVGTAMRIRLEEQLLAARHGAAFEEYRRRVPAIVPRFR